MPNRRLGPILRAVACSVILGCLIVLLLLPTASRAASASGGWSGTLQQNGSAYAFDYGMNLTESTGGAVSGTSWIRVVGKPLSLWEMVINNDSPSKDDIERVGLLSSELVESYKGPREIALDADSAACCALRAFTSICSTAEALRESALIAWSPDIRYYDYLKASGAIASEWDKITDACFEAIETELRKWRK